MSALRLEYDGDQHGTAYKEPQNKRVSIDCPFTGKGEEFSPGNLVGIGVAGCMLLSMGAVAQRDKLDLQGTTIDIEQLVFNIPRQFSPSDRQKLERAAGLCPIKASFRAETNITAEFNFTNAEA
jgi:uncharacterized OsmC-like protein